ncbi:MAG: ATP-binding cassette domain-containing protein [Conexibacter sp.]
MADIAIDRVSKVFPNGVTAVHEASLDIGESEVLVMVGPSGSGKSTLLRMIAGLEEVSSGAIRIGGRDVTDLPPERRDIAMVFQSYALYPNMTVAENLAFGLRMRKAPKAQREQRVREVAAILGLEDLLGRRPGALSGGQRQRVAMGRAIVREPQVFLMDEPLSNLDSKLRVTMRAELQRLHERLGVTTVYVTHDQVEATTLGHRVAVLHEGRVLQCDTPSRLFDRPANLFVAAFIGSPSMNLVEAQIDDGCACFAGHRLRLSGGAPSQRRFILGFRPTDLHLLSPDAPENPAALEVCADVVENHGGESIVVFPIDAPPVIADVGSSANTGQGEERLLAQDQRSRLTARLSGRHTVRPGEPMRLAVDVRHLHFFDPRTGDAIEVDEMAQSDDVTYAAMDEVRERA